jgi:hypothetical protein
MKEVGDSSVTPPDFGAAFGGMSIAGMGEVAVVSVTQILVRLYAIKVGLIRTTLA